MILDFLAWFPLHSGQLVLVVWFAIQDVAVCVATSSSRSIEITVETGTSVVVFAALKPADASITASAAELVPNLDSVAMSNAPFVAIGSDEDSSLFGCGGSKVCNRFAMKRSFADTLKRMMNMV